MVWSIQSGENPIFCICLIQPYCLYFLTHEFQIYIVSSFFAYTVILISLLDTTPSPTYAQLLPWAVAIPLELIILGGCLALYTSPHHEPIVGDPAGGPLRNIMTSWETVEVIVAVVRLLTLLGIVIFYTLSSVGWRSYRHKDATARFASGEASETTRLLNGHRSGINGDNYGSSSPNRKRDSDFKPEDAWVRPTTVPSTSWWEYISGYSLFFPYLWPSKSRRLQLIVVACFFLVVLQLVINVMVPIQIGRITNVLSGDTGEEFYIPWRGICIYVLFRWLQGNQGLIGSLRSFLWIPVGQYSYMELSTAAFEHVHSLSLDFHLGKKTGEVLSALSKGNSINTFLEQFTFQVVPMLIDLCVAVGYFWIVFDVYYALVVAIVTFIYLYVTIRMAQWRAAIRRQMVNASRQEDAVK